MESESPKNTRKVVITLITIYKNQEFGEIRTVQLDGDVWFVGKDVAAALAYKATSSMRKLIDDEDYTEIDPQNPDMTRFIQNGTTPLEPNPSVRRMLLVNESGLYQAIFNSKLPNAKKFKRWITSEVLPSIRKYGLYATDELLKDPDLLIAALEELKAAREQNAIQHQQILEMQPKASYYDVVLNCKEAVPISVIAKDYGKSARWMNQKLKQLGIQYKQGRIWLLYQDYAEGGYTCTKTFAYKAGNGEDHSKVHAYWTQKGRLFIYDLLKQEGIVPLIERKEVA